MSEIDPPNKTNWLEIFVAILLGFGALSGGWAGYQSSQWGSTATENYGKASTTATRAATLYNFGVTVANRDTMLDLQAKQLTLSAMTSGDEQIKLRDTTVAKYLYTQQMSKEGYEALGFPAEFHTKDKDKAAQFPDELLVTKGLETGGLDEKYLGKILTTGNAKFAEADQVFAEGQKVSGTSTQFGLVGMIFTITLLLGGLALVLKSNVRWGFLGLGYVTLGYGLLKMFMLPWYSA